MSKQVAIWNKSKYMTLFTSIKPISLYNPWSFSPSVSRKEAIYAGDLWGWEGLPFYSSVEYKHISHHPVWSPGHRKPRAQGWSEVPRTVGQIHGSMQGGQTKQKWQPLNPRCSSRPRGTQVKKKHWPWSRSQRRDLPADPAAPCRLASPTPMMSSNSCL